MARLPQPGADSGTWGGILNDYLTQSLDADGLLKANTVGTTQIQANAITTTQLAPNSVSPSTVQDLPQSKITNLTSDLAAKADKVTVTAATKTKLTYNNQGVVTAGTDATTADIADSTNKRYVTDAELAVLAATSGTNTGDQDLSGFIQRMTTGISTSITAGAASHTDYVYLASGTLTVTLPTAVGNTNRYTIKNQGTGVVTIAPTASQTIDGSSSAVLSVQNASLDIISTTSQWNIV